MADRPSPVVRFFGYAMIAVGVLMTLLSGGCTLFGLYVSIAEKNATGMLTTVLVFGLPFVAIGIALIAGGRSLSRRRGPSQPPDRVF